MIDIIDVREYNTRDFNTIGIETAALCNRSCVFCPNHEFKRPDDYMSWDMIHKILDDLVDMNYKGRIAPYIYNEPMRDERMLDIIALIREKLPKTCIMINTNGDYFKSPADIEACFEAGLNQMMINIYAATDGDEDSERVAKGVQNAQRRHDQVQEWVDGLDLDQTDSLYRHIKGRACQVAAKYGVEKDGSGFGGGFELQNRSGLIEWIPPLKEPLKKMCVRPFRVAQINWKGDMLLCCNDYHGETACGNVMDSTVKELWNSDNMNTYRLFLQQKRRDIFLCDKCDFRGGFYPHMVYHVTFGESDEEIIERSKS